jgi:hypothetical protein
VLPIGMQTPVASTDRSREKSTQVGRMPFLIAKALRLCARLYFQCDKNHRMEFRTSYEVSGGCLRAGPLVILSVQLFCDLIVLPPNAFNIEC